MYKNDISIFDMGPTASMSSRPRHPITAPPHTSEALPVLLSDANAILVAAVLRGSRYGVRTQNFRLTSMINTLTLSLTAVGLSGDAFAASVARGAADRRVSIGPALRNGLTFGGVEGTMCLAGWLLAAAFSAAVVMVDHWIALVLLTVIGGKMILESFEVEAPDAAGEAEQTMPSGFWTTVLTAVGTSVDSAAVGAALSLSGAPVVVALLIGGASATFSTMGFLLGPLIGAALGKRAEFLGGLLLIGIGLSIWIDHVILA